MAARIPLFDDLGEAVPKPNYHQQRKQKEVARKARQQEKQQRRATRPNGTETDSGIEPAPDAAAPENTTTAEKPT